MKVIFEEIAVVSKRYLYLIAIFICICFVYILSVPTVAALKETNPNTVSSYLDDIGLKTGGWKQYYDTVYGCTSSYKTIGSGAIQNNLAYYGEGKAKKAERLKLVLNINNKAEAKSSHNALVTAASKLITKALGAKLPQAIMKALEKGYNASCKIGSASVKVTREDWSTGKGYDIKFVIE